MEQLKFPIFASAAATEVDDDDDDDDDDMFWLNYNQLFLLLHKPSFLFFSHSYRASW